MCGPDTMSGPLAACLFVDPAAAAQTQAEQTSPSAQWQVPPPGARSPMALLPIAISVQLTDMQISLIISSSKINYILQ